MTFYSVQPRGWIFVKGCGFLALAKNMGKNTGKNISKNLSSKYSQKILDPTKQSATDALETASKGVIEKAAETTSDLIEKKIADKISGVPNMSPKNNSETNEEEILREKYIYITRTKAKNVVMT